METTRDGLWRFRGMKDDMLTALQDNPIAAAVRADERARIRRELRAWLIGDLLPEDAGLVNGRRIVDEIDRICPGKG